MRNALSKATNALVAVHGGDFSKWRWDTAHAARSEHRPLSNVPVLSKLFDIRTPTAGDTDTVLDLANTKPRGKIRLIGQ